MKEVHGTDPATINAHRHSMVDHDKVERGLTFENTFCLKLAKLKIFDRKFARLKIEKCRSLKKRRKQL